MPQVIAAAGGLFGAGGFFSTTVGRLVASVALSALSAALQPRPEGRSTSVVSTTAGDNTPIVIVFGRTAVGGNLAAPIYKSNSKWRTYVIDLADHPIKGVLRSWVDGDLIDWVGDRAADGITHMTQDTPIPGGFSLGVADIADGYRDGRGFTPFGGPLTRKGNSHIGFSFFDGRQTEVDPLMILQHGNEATRPWQADMIGIGVAYVTIQAFIGSVNLERLTSDPTTRHEVDGIEVYDPRADAEVFSLNPVVMVRAIAKGIALADGSVWGGEVDDVTLPDDVWTEAMNRCDDPVPTSDGGTEPQFRAGYEVRIATGVPDIPGDRPADAIEEILKAADGRFAESGDRWLVHVGRVNLPAMSITDNDIVVSQSESFSDETNSDGRITAVSVTYPDPESQYEPVKSPLYVNETLEAEIGTRNSSAPILNACPYPDQAQRLSRKMALDHNRRRTHVAVFPPAMLVMEQFDTFSWDSVQHDYDAKRFEVQGYEINAESLCVTLTSREVEATDSDISAADYVDRAAPVPPPPALVPVTVEGITATPFLDSNAGDTRAVSGIKIGWTPDERWDRVMVTVRNEATAEVVYRTVIEPADEVGGHVVTGLVGAASYEVQLTPTSRGIKTEGSDWLSVVAADARLRLGDLSEEVTDELGKGQQALTAVGIAAQAAQDALDNAATVAGDLGDLTAGFQSDLATAFGEVDAAIDQARDDATAEVTSARQTLTALIGSSDGVIDDPYFAALGPETWSHFPAEGTLTVLPNLMFPVGQSVELTTTSANQSALIHRSDRAGWIGQGNVGGLVAEIDFEVTSGEIDGAGVRVVWTHETASVQAIATLASGLTGQFLRNRNLTATVLLPKPAGAAGTFVRSQIQVYANGTPNTTGSAKTIRFHRVRLRLATVEELAQGQIIEDMVQAQADITAEQVARADADIAIAATVTALTTRVGTSEGAITAEQVARADADTAIAGTVTALTTRVGTAEGAIFAEQVARADSDSAIAADVTALTARVGTNEAGIASEQVARTDADTAIAGTVTALTARVGTNEAGIASEQVARADGDAALAGQINTLTGRVDGNEAGITQIVGLTVDDQTAFGTLMAQLTVDAGGTSAAVADFAAARAELDGFAQAYAGVTVSTNGGNIAGFLATSFSNPDGTGGSLLQLLGSVVVPGTLSTNALTVGLGQNLLSNTNFIDKLAGWIVDTVAGTAGAESSMFLRPAGQPYAGATYPTLAVFQSGTGTTGNLTFVGRSTNDDGGLTDVSVAPGEWIEAQMRAASLRCQSQIRIQWLDAAGATLSFSLVATISANNPSSTNPESWPVFGGKAQAPANAAFARIHIRKLPTAAGEPNSTLYVHKPQLARTHASASGLMGWSPGGTTTINGARIETGSILAESINTDSLIASGATPTLFGAYLVDPSASNPGDEVFVAPASGYLDLVEIDGITLAPYVFAPAGLAQAKVSGFDVVSARNPAVFKFFAEFKTDNSLSGATPGQHNLSFTVTVEGWDGVQWTIVGNGTATRNLDYVINSGNVTAHFVDASGQCDPATGGFDRFRVGVTPKSTNAVAIILSRVLFTIEQSTTGMSA